MKVIAGYEMKSGKELCIGVWDTIKECAKDLGLSVGSVNQRLAWARDHIPFERGRGGVMPQFYLRYVEIDEETDG